MDLPVSLQFQEVILENILSFPQNKLCADCKFQCPDWISLNYAVLICYKCSGVHRSLGVQNTRVKSVKLDSLTLRQLFLLAYIHNEKANKYWEANMPNDIVRPGTNSTPRELSQFIRAKYIDKVFVDPDKESPVEEVNRKLNEEENEEKENENNETIFKRKQAELKKLLNMRVITRKPATHPPLQIPNSSPEKPNLNLRPPRKTLTGNNSRGEAARTPPPNSMRTFKATFGMDTLSPNGNLIEKSHSDASFPLFEGLTLRSPGGKQSSNSRDSTTKSQKKFSQFGILSENSKKGSDSKFKEKLSQEDIQTSTLPSIELADLKEHHFMDPDGKKIYVDSLINPGDMDEIPEVDGLNRNLSELNSRNYSIPPATLEKHQSITVTLKQALKENNNQSSHLKRPSEAFESMNTPQEEVKVINFLGKRNEKYPKLLVIINCLLIHLLLGYIYTWGAISPYVTSFLARNYKFNLYSDYIEIASCNIFLYLGKALGTFMSERFVNFLGMRISALVCFASTSAIILISSLTTNAFVHAVLFTMLPGIFLGLMYYIPFYYAIQYFYYPGALKIFFYLANGLGAFMFINLFPVLLWQDGLYNELTAASPVSEINYFSENVNARLPELLQVMGLCLLVLGSIASIMLHPKLNFVEKDWSSWEDKERGLLSRQKSVNLEMSRAQFELILQVPTPKKVATAARYLFFLSVFFFTVSGFLFYAYKVIGYFDHYSDATLSLLGGVGMIILGIGKAFGVLLYRKVDFRLNIKIAIVMQAILGLSCYFLINNRAAFMAIFLTAMLLQGVVFALLIEEAANAFDAQEESLITGYIVFGIAVSNLLSFLFFKSLLLLEVHEWLYAALTVPLVIAGVVIKYYPKVSDGTRKLSRGNSHILNTAHSWNN